MPSTSSGSLPTDASGEVGPRGVSVGATKASRVQIPIISCTLGPQSTFV